MTVICQAEPYVKLHIVILDQGRTTQSAAVPPQAESSEHISLVQRLGTWNGLPAKRNHQVSICLNISLQFSQWRKDESTSFRVIQSHSESDFSVKLQHAVCSSGSSSASPLGPTAVGGGGGVLSVFSAKSLSFSLMLTSELAMETRFRSYCYWAATGVKREKEKLHQGGSSLRGLKPRSGGKEVERSCDTFKIFWFKAYSSNTRTKSVFEMILIIVIVLTYIYIYIPEKGWIESQRLLFDSRGGAWNSTSSIWHGSNMKRPNINNCYRVIIFQSLNGPF